MTRVYFVIDMKSFFASVECAERGLDPWTANLVVADAERTEKTICLAVSVNMKKLGVKNRCRLWQVPKDLDYIIARPRMKKYIEYAAEIYGIYLKYMDKNDIHVYSIDECILDVTDYLKLYNTKAKPFALKLMSEIWEKLHIPSTCGIGTNMYLAKIALDITAKHSKDRIGWLDEEKYIRTLSHHKPITDFWRISTGTANRLSKYGVYDQAGIRDMDPDILYKEFGVNAELIIDHAYGREPTLMSDIKAYKSKSKSVSSHEILACSYNKKDALLVLKEMLQNGCYRLYQQNYVTNSVTIGIGFEDGFGAHATIPLTISTCIYNYIIDDVVKAYNKIVPNDVMIKTLGYGFNVLDKELEHYDLFTDMEDVSKEKKLLDSIMKLKDKYGKNSVLKAMDFEEKATIRERNMMIGGHRSGEDEEK
ncbi:MAG: hypothetical protein K6A63_00665 [Acholeplasmatales bacterium]|nr:hypothetical protein [Acholeplasmatales bacterium]